MPAPCARCDDRAMLTNKAVTSEDLPGRGRLRIVDARKFYGRGGDRIAALDGVTGVRSWSPAAGVLAVRREAPG